MEFHNEKLGSCVLQVLVSQISYKSSEKSASKSGIIKNITKILENQGYNVDTNIGNSEFKVDLGVIDPRNNNRYLLGILLDGPVYAECRTTRDRELSQASVLKGLGWNIIRMWSMDWWENKEIETDRLLDCLDKLKNDQSIDVRMLRPDGKNHYADAGKRRGDGNCGRRG